MQLSVLRRICQCDACGEPVYLLLQGPKEMEAAVDVRILDGAIFLSSC